MDTRAAKWRTDADTERRKWTDLEQTRQKQKSDRVQQIQRELRPLQADLSDFQRTLTNDTDNVNRTNREISALRTDLEKVTVGGPRYLEIKKVLDDKLKQLDAFSTRMATSRDKVATTQRRIDFLEGRIDALMY
jgi:peptidoglycan hydrolase CwlO-like protein